MTELTTTVSLIKARRLGSVLGLGAGTWVFDSNTTTERYREILRAIEDGDPVLENYITEPSWLSGMWGTPTPRSLAADLGIDPDLDAYLLDEACTAYEQAAGAAFWAEVERQARVQTEA